MTYLPEEKNEKEEKRDYRKERLMANFLVSPELLEYCLNFPKDHHIFGAEWSFENGSFRLYVSGPLMPYCEPGNICETIMPVFEVDTETKEFKLNLLGEVKKEDK